MRYLLDAGPFGLLAKLRFDGDLPGLQAGVLAVSGTVKDEARPDNSEPNRSLLAERDADGRALVDVLEVRASSQEAEILSKHIRPKSHSASCNLGEDESLAIAIVQSDLIFVTADKNGAFRALSELGPGHVCLEFDLWSWIEGEAWFSEGAFEQAMAKTAKRLQVLPGIPLRFSDSPAPAG